VSVGAIGADAKRRIRPLVVRYRHRGIHGRDVFLASYPRSGSTWLRFMLYEALTGRTADFAVINRAIPYVGDQQRAPALLPQGGRLIKTHERFRPEGPKIVYLVRDIRSVLPSMYRQQVRAGYVGSMEDFFERALEGDVGPFGSWADHVRFWLGGSTGHDQLLLRFEDLRTVPAEVLGSILSFAGVEDVSDEVLRSAVRDNDLSAMKAKESRAPNDAIINRRDDLPFVGSGEAEGWRTMDPVHLRRAEQEAGDLLRRLGYPLEGCG
jgi:hypothetical protein